MCLCIFAHGVGGSYLIKIMISLTAAISAGKQQEAREALIDCFGGIQPAAGLGSGREGGCGSL